MKMKFSFAGFNWPRHVVELPKGRIANRLAAFKRGERRDASPYYHAPAPLNGKHPGAGFYLGSAGMPGLRWQWADEVKDVRIDHKGWYTDEDGAGDLMRGIVIRLPHGRGFLYGWSLGEGMSASIEGDIWPGDDEAGAARAADQCAESMAEDAREHQARWREAADLDREIADACEELRDLRLRWSNALHAHLDAMRKGAGAAADYLQTVTLDRIREDFAKAAEELRTLRERLPEFADVER